MHFHILKMYKDKEVKKNVKNIFLSICDVKVFLTFTLTENLKRVYLIQTNKKQIQGHM